MKDTLFFALLSGFCPAVLCALIGFFTFRAKGGLRRVGRLLNLLAALYFSAAAVFLLVVVTTAPARGDGAGMLYVLVFAALSALAAFLCWALVFSSGGEA